MIVNLEKIALPVLTARGKLSTLNVEARERRKKIRDAMQACTDQARNVVRVLEDTDLDPRENLDIMELLIANSQRWTDELVEMAPEMEKLKAEAWPKEKK